MITNIVGDISYFILFKKKTTSVIFFNNAKILYEKWKVACTHAHRVFHQIQRNQDYGPLTTKY